jgi:hypothetical protein
MAPSTISSDLFKGISSPNVLRYEAISTFLAFTVDIAILLRQNPALNLIKARIFQVFNLDLGCF